MADVLQLLNLLLVPTVGLLWRVSGQLAHVAAVQGQHEQRIQNLERKPA